jgi:uncharacterized protein YndB with AHSA1/START domain
VNLTGSLIDVDDRPALRFERRLRSSVARVWRAVTAPDELERWFVVAIPWTPHEGETFDVFGQQGTVTRIDESRLIAWHWAGQRFQIELLPDNDGCLLVFTHILGDRAAAPEQAAGWEGYLNRLETHLAGGFLSDEQAHTDASRRHEAYAQRFGLDPEPGRRGCR